MAVYCLQAAATIIDPTKDNKNTTGMLYLAQNIIHVCLEESKRLLLRRILLNPL